VAKKRNRLRELLLIKDHLLGEKIVLDVWDDLKLNEDEPEVMMQDCLFGHQLSGHLEAVAEARYELGKVELDHVYAEMDNFAREMEVMARPTDAKVKAWILREGKYITKRKELIELKMKYQFLKVLSKSFVMKADFIRTKVASRRAELAMPATSVETVKRKKKKKKKKSEE